MSAAWAILLCVGMVQALLPKVGDIVVTHRLTASHMAIGMQVGGVITSVAAQRSDSAPGMVSVGGADKGDPELGAAMCVLQL